MSAPPDVGDVAVRLAEALAKAGLPHALGGALALGVAGVVRATTDVDLDVFVGPERYDEMLDALASAGCEFDRARALAQATDGATVVLRCDGWRVDVFVPTIPFYDEARERVVVASFAGLVVPFLDAESLAVFKLLFFRGKDLVDLERLVAVGRLDHAWVRAHVAEMMGEDDPRVEAWDEIVRRAGGGAAGGEQRGS